MAWLRASSVVVAEVTVVSLGVGYELGIAEGLGLPVLCLYRRGEDVEGVAKKKLSAMSSGNTKFTIEYYKTLEDAKSAVDHFMHSLSLSCRLEKI